MSTQDFIKNAIKIHGDKYDYSLVNYINSKTNVIIICKEHGEFMQRTSHHTSGHGCKGCAKINISNGVKASTVSKKGEYIDRIKLIHNNKYLYPNFKPAKTTDKVKIICPKHGLFEQTLANHLQGSGCHKCGSLRIAEAVKNISRDNKQDFSHITPPQGSKVIPLTRGKYALVDEEDYERVNKYNWCASKESNSWYAYTTINNKHRSLHKFLLKSNKGRIDHINHDGLDNRKINLRDCTPSENAQNGRSHRDSVSKYKGVSWFKRDNKWKAQISINGKNKHLGYFLSEEEAARAYDAKAKELHKEFAYLNFPVI